MNRLQVAQRIVGEVSKHESIVPKRDYLMLQWLRREIEAELLKRDERASGIAEEHECNYDCICGDAIAAVILKEDEE